MTCKSPILGRRGPLVEFCTAGDVAERRELGARRRSRGAAARDARRRCAQRRRPRRRRRQYARGAAAPLGRACGRRRAPAGPGARGRALALRERVVAVLDRHVGAARERLGDPRPVAVW